MTDRQENKFSMYLAVQIVCNNFGIIWGEFIAFVKAFGDLQAIISQITETRLIQEGNTKGVAENKQKEEDEMINKTVSIASAVFAYASEIGDNELREKINYSPSKLKFSRDTILRDRCQLVHEEASKVIDNLGDYGILAADLVELQKEIDDYAAIIAKPRTAIATRATATAHLIELFKQGDEILYDRLDKLMEQYKSNNPDFYVNYKNARSIVDLGVRHTE
ncbi:MAG: hypothetical protein JEY97_10380 [Bacteroidales bacterium]|nr:hypothetical protein [Bacteroidales bacterium]